MKVVKIALIALMAIMAFPVAFLIFYSIQAGCLLCFEGEAAGSWQESALNLALLLGVVGGLLWAFIAKKRRQ